MNDASGPGPTIRYRSRIGKLLGVTLISSAMLVGATIPAAAAELMRVTFIRHGQSAGNASGLIDTSTPGPLLTQTGQEQSEAVVGRLGVNNYDGVYASVMQRTQLTAAPLSRYLHLPVRILPGVQEIEAGVFEGTPESQAANGYGRFPLAWALQGNRDLRIPGSIDGNEFDARMDGALQQIYDNGDRNAVVFSHGGAIMFWTMMNAKNLTTEQKLDLLRYHPLSNTNSVVVEGNSEDGWTLVNWNGQQFGPDASLGDEFRLQLRTLQRQLSTAVTNVFASFATLNPATVLATIAASFSDTVVSIAKFAGAVNNKLATEWAKQNAPSTAPQTQAAAVAEPAIAQADPQPQAAATARRTSTMTVAERDSRNNESEATDQSVTEPVTKRDQRSAELAGDSETAESSETTETTETTVTEADKPATSARTPKSGERATSTRESSSSHTSRSRADTADAA